MLGRAGLAAAATTTIMEWIFLTPVHPDRTALPISANQVRAQIGERPAAPYCRVGHAPLISRQLATTIVPTSSQCLNRALLQFRKVGRDAIDSNPALASRMAQTGA